MREWSEKGLTRAWKALARQEAGEDWRFVSLTKMGEICIEAGCHFPGIREALIVSFPGSWTISPTNMPEGKGFDVTCIKNQSVFSNRTAIALVRRDEGASDIFAIMVVDILRTIEYEGGSANREIVKIFLERVREWQFFMTRTRRPLSPDAQVGLLGELWMLRLLTDSAIGISALDCWRGPLRAAQDFHLRGGAIEVKSTAGTGTFLARINSIEQLDGDRSPIFLCTFRFEENANGISLVQMVNTLREKFAQTDIQRGFDALLMVMGYHDEHAPSYSRTLILKENKAFLSNNNMSRLTRAMLPAAVRSATYTLDLDALGTASVKIPDMLNAFGLN